MRQRFEELYTDLLLLLPEKLILGFGPPHMFYRAMNFKRWFRYEVQESVYILLLSLGIYFQVCSLLLLQVGSYIYLYISPYKSYLHYCSKAKKHNSMFRRDMIKISLIPSPSYKKIEKGSGQTCIGPVLPLHCTVWRAEQSCFAT